jgi:hypothetical protein
MTPIDKENGKYVLTMAGALAALLVIVITATANITTRLTRNSTDHEHYDEAIAAFTERTKVIEDKLDVVVGKQIQVMTKLGIKERKIQ